MQTASNPLDRTVPEIVPPGTAEAAGACSPVGIMSAERAVDLSTRPQVIRMNGIEVVSILGSRVLRHTDDRPEGRSSGG